MPHLRIGFVCRRRDFACSICASNGWETGRPTQPSPIDRRLICSIVLAGEVKATYGRRQISFGSDRQPGADGMLVSVAEPVSFSRCAQKGARTLKVNVTVDGAWLESSGLLEAKGRTPIVRFATNHLAVRHWRPNRRMIEIAKEILAPSPLVPEFERLYLETRAIELIMQDTGALADGAYGSTSSAIPFGRSRDIEEYLAANLHRPLDLRTIAGALAMSPSSLQRACRATFGLSVFDLLRKLRLDSARRSLAVDRVSVAEAAYLAGYVNPANFATTFKRAFGVPPSQVRRQR
jgi:AraC-like DNA-binding protein